MAYSLDLQQRIFFVKEKRGLTFKEASEIFSVDIRTFFCWQKRIDPKMTRDKPATKIDMHALKQDSNDYIFVQNLLNIESIF